MTPKVTLLTHTRLPLETVYSVWQMSKSDAPLMTPEEVQAQVPAEEVRDLFRRVIEQRIPISEHVDFVFALEGISVSWREQAVRHRIGTTPSPERVGIDIVPDLADSSFWSQSMRIMDMGRFADAGGYRLPESLSGKQCGPTSAEDLFRGTMHVIQTAYRSLVDAGVPMEDARELIPLGATHSMSWRLNIASLQHVIGKRSCWILQGGIWEPVIRGMVNELAEKVDPIFRTLATPPCIKRDKFSGCVFHEENARRYSGEDKLPVCPLHWSQHGGGDVGALGIRPGGNLVRDEEVQRRYLPLVDEMRARAEIYSRFWGRDPYSGERR